MLKYDNYDDVKTKLFNTICMYDGKAAFVKDISIDLDNPEMYFLHMALPRARSKKVVPLDDPKLNYLEFNLGYSNHLNYGSVWWYRIPYRQYHQGLRSNQLGWCSTKNHNPDFGFTDHICRMLENEYPTFDEAEKVTKDQQNSPTVAFNKDFSVAWDRIHHDLLIEYKGTLIGCCKSPKEADLLSEYKHLTEAFREATYGR